MIGLVLAAGAGRRLWPHVDGLPKTLVPIGRDGAATVTPLDVILANFAAVGVTEIAVVVGYAVAAVRDRVPELSRRHGVELELVVNDRAEDWNNCYSLWCARHLFGRGCLLANGDTVHPVSVERTLLADRAGGSDGGILLALDMTKPLADEEMKVAWSADRGLVRITKAMDPATATGEYIGLAVIRPAAAAELAAALERTWRADPALYYEDGFQAYVDAGHRIDAVPIGRVPWVEVDDHRDLARARELLPLLSGIGAGGT